jgi:DNA-binding protein H-NS
LRSFIGKKGMQMATYLELRARGEKLLAEAEELRVKELEDVIQDIKEKIKAYGLTAQDLGLSAGGATRRKRSSTSSPKAAPKYRGPNGETWSGGRGRKPRWVTDALAKGRKIEDFAV